jgi:MYXO-CTERM domain-containing protein
MRWLLGVGLAVSAARAHATPITLYAEGTPGAGFAPRDVAAAQAAGAAAPLALEGLVASGLLTLTRRDALVESRGGSRRRPARGHETWLLEVAPDAPESLLGGAWLVVLGHDPSDPARYRSRKVGLEIDTASPWQLVSEGPAGAVYLGYRLGALAPGVRSEVPIDFRVAQRLKRHGGDLVFPRYAVAFAPVPEPGPGALALLALGGAWPVRRRR